jgi:hypothetical protein
MWRFLIANNKIRTADLNKVGNTFVWRRVWVWNAVCGIMGRRRLTRSFHIFWMNYSVHFWSRWASNVSRPAHDNWFYNHNSILCLLLFTNLGQYVKLPTLLLALWKAPRLDSRQMSVCLCINKLIIVKVKSFVFFAVRTKFLNII